jgi:hypothetical protein
VPNDSPPEERAEIRDVVIKPRGLPDQLSVSQLDTIALPREKPLGVEYREMPRPPRPRR